MKNLWLGVLVFSPAILISQASTPAASSANSRVMIVGVAHDNSIMGGGISSSHFLSFGKVEAQPIAWISPAGEWKRISCVGTNGPGLSPECERFNRDYLSKPHDYTVVSADGFGAVVHVKRMVLDQDCFGFGGDGDITGGQVKSATVAAESGTDFISGTSAHRLSEQEAQPIRRALAAVLGKKLDSTEELRVYSVELEGRALLVVQRAFQNYADKPKYTPDRHTNLEFILAIGEMSEGHFRLLHWKQNTEDDNEQILGLIHLKSGRDFLVDATSDPEGNSFRIYGIRDGKPTMVFEGGGGSC